jgi:hypothetical protein
LDTKEFSIEKIFSSLKNFSRDGITELSITDEKFSQDAGAVLKLAAEIKKYAPELFVSILISPQIISQNLVNALSEIFCSIEIPFRGTEKNGTLLFDKKFFSSRAKILNSAQMIFGFDMEWGAQKGDTFRLFRDRLDFAVSLYPNHIDFPQLEKKPFKEIASTGIYSSKDMDFSRGISFACKTFYSCGRAVPWFKFVLDALKIPASTFFADFEEFQLCNSCSMEAEFNPDECEFETIKKLQLSFLQQKFEEKNKGHLFAAVRDSVILNGAFSELSAEKKEIIVETSYNPDDLLSSEILNVEKFCENVPMENCTVKVFLGRDGEDYKII